MSAAVSVQDAIYAALVADAGLTEWLGATEADRRIYEVLAPAGTALATSEGAAHPYLTLAGGAESDFNTLCAPGFEDVLRVRAWVPGTAERMAKVGYGHVRRVLDGQALALDAHTCLRCDVTLEATVTDPDGQATQAVATVRVFSESNS